MDTNQLLDQNCSNADISRFAVSLFFRRIDEYATKRTVKERLVTKIISAVSEEEAFGKVYDIYKADYIEFDLVYKLTVPINDNEVKQFNFKQKRLAKNLTLRQVEEKTGISNSYLSQLENGKIKRPSFEVIEKLNNIYKI